MYEFLMIEMMVGMNILLNIFEMMFVCWLIIFMEADDGDIDTYNQ